MGLKPPEPDHSSLELGKFELAVQISNRLQELQNLNFSNCRIPKQRQFDYGIVVDGKIHLGTG